MGCRWVFTMKFKSDGSLEPYNARLVAKSYTQSYGIYYKETFALIAKLNTVWILISLAVNLTRKLQRYDFKNAFLPGDLEKEI